MGAFNEVTAFAAGFLLGHVSMSLVVELVKLLFCRFRKRK